MEPTLATGTTEHSDSVKKRRRVQVIWDDDSTDDEPFYTRRCNARGCKNQHRKVNPFSLAGVIGPVCAACYYEKNPSERVVKPAKRKAVVGFGCEVCGSGTDGGLRCFSCQDLSSLGFNPWHYHRDVPDQSTDPTAGECIKCGFRTELDWCPDCGRPVE